MKIDVIIRNADVGLREFLFRMEARLMAKLAEVSQEVADLKASVEAFVTALEAEIARVEALLDGGASQGDLQTILDNLKGIQATADAGASEANAERP